MATIQKFLFIALAILPAVQPLEQSNHPDLYAKPCTNDSIPDPPSLVHCDLDKNMYCSIGGICECIVGDRGRIFSHFEKKCIEVASPENNFNCDKDVQCKQSSFGKYSRCNMDMDQCECYDENEKTVLVENVCYFQKLGISRSLQSCSIDADCHSSSLGRLSRCNKAVDQCECYDSSQKVDVTLYNGKCVIKKMLGQFCYDDDECRAGYHKNAVCVQHPTALRAEKVCTCPDGVSCDGDDSGAHSSFQSQSMMMIGVTTVMMGLLATKVLS